jgi:hypothetical protein
MEVEVEDNGDRDEIRRLVHTFMIIILNSRNYGIHFFDSSFGTSTKYNFYFVFKYKVRFSL